MTPGGTIDGFAVSIAAEIIGASGHIEQQELRVRADVDFRRPLFGDVAHHHRRSDPDS
jgi:hypothetical protein